MWKVTMTEVEVAGLKKEIKEVILEALNIKNIKPEDIKDNALCLQRIIYWDLIPLMPSN
ncbi:MAG: hypothetical protein R2764_21770 [Bacteroidales bacterium]